MSKAKAKKKSGPHKRTARTPRILEQETQGNMALQALLELWRADHDKRPPDPTAVAFIARGFEKWQRADGAQKLDEVLGLTISGSGHKPAVVSFNTTVRDGWYFHNMAMLVGAGFSVADAAAAVAEYLKRNPEHLKNWNTKTLTAKRAYDVFEREGGRSLALEGGYFGDPGSRPCLCEATLGEDRERLISHLAPDLIPVDFTIRGKT